ncbi:MAG: hypothetical protein KF745_14160 [Phycisphaeraceae bacterium]|nr:hypothetical protein [Phycisphaeraceae bacterium]
MRLFVLARTILFGAALWCVEAAFAGPPEGCRVGAGLQQVNDFGYDNAFVDVVKQSRPFGSPGTPWDESSPLDANGWPIGDCGVVLMSGVDGQPGFGGTYRISFECVTTPTISTVVCPGTIHDVVRNPATGVVTALLDYPEATASSLNLAFTGTVNGIRNLRVIRPGYSDTAVFTTPFLNHIQRFRTLRFMDWTRTNGDPERLWSDRATTSSVSYAGDEGVPWEVCIDLCNRVGADLWVNIPHMADDEYVTELAALIQNRLQPQLKVYVEYSNEVWNYGLPQAVWNLEQAVREGTSGVAPYGYDGLTDEQVWSWRRVAFRLKQISDDFREVFGPDQMMSRIRPVYAAQISFIGQHDTGLSFIEDNYGPPSNYFYAIAGAPYFGPDNAVVPHTPSGTIADQADALLTAMAKSASYWAQSREMRVLSTLASFHRLRLLAYEGGPDTVGPDYIQAKRAASYSPRMQTICEDYLNDWARAGGGLFMWYVAGAGTWQSQNGTFTMVEAISDTSNPKLDAISSILAASPPSPTVGKVIPGEIDARFHAYHLPAAIEEPFLGSLAINQEYYFPVRAGQSGIYPIRLMMGSDQTPSSIQVSTGPGQVAVLWAPFTGSSTIFAPTATANLALTAGPGAIRLRILNNYAYNVQSLLVEAPCLTLTLEPASVAGCRTQDAVFAVAASGAGPISYRWQRDGAPLLDGATGIGSVITGASSPTLRILHPRPGDRGEYRCVVTGSCGSVPSSAASLSLCEADINCDGVVDPSDVAGFVAIWAASLANYNPDADFDADGQISPSDIAAYISVWLQSVVTPC